VTLRYLGVDLGTKRIGLALSSPDGLFASPLMVIQRQGGKRDLKEIARIAADYGVDRIVVGLPLNLRGEGSLAAEHAAAETRELGRLTDVPLDTYDERLTSVAAEKALVQGGVRREDRRQVVDKVAAAMMLQSYLDKARRENGPEDQAL
jgi:putative Holliday junction resolvase